jgi:signal transduction histidine kinase
VSRRERRTAAGVGAGARGDGVGAPRDVLARSGAWRPRNWHLRTKLLAVLLIPTLTAMCLAGLRVNSELSSARQLSELTVRVRIDIAVSALVHSLQRERDLSVRHVASGRSGSADEMREQRATVDDRLGAFSTTMTAAGGELPDDAMRPVREIDDRLGVLTGIRFAAEHSAYPSDAVLRSYSELISGILDVRDRTVATISEPELARTRLATNALARISDQVSTKRALLAASLEEGALSQERVRALLGADAEQAAARAEFGKFATAEQRRMYEDTVIGLIVDSGNDMFESALSRAANEQPLDEIDPQRWDTAATYTANRAYEVHEAMLLRMRERTETLAAAARVSVLRDSAIVLGALLISLLLTMIVGRSLLRPLRVLRSSALEVAGRRLPAAVRGILDNPQAARTAGTTPVPVFTREEVGQVARAFDAVHAEAVRLASEQALLRQNVNAMFVNLSKRSQALAERQLSVLDRMEAEEQEPDTLAGLFELDHLATRMRRNSENLLVLSGDEFGGALPGHVSAAEVVGAALSEVEDYQRVSLGPMPEFAVVGAAAGDVVHVISELLENATRYSPQHTAVRVVNAPAPKRAWRIEIIDEGQGMSAEAIDRANARLANPGTVDVEVSHRMGLYVFA